MAFVRHFFSLILSGVFSIFIQLSMQLQGVSLISVFPGKKVGLLSGDNNRERKKATYVTFTAGFFLTLSSAFALCVTLTIFRFASLMKAKRWWLIPKVVLHRCCVTCFTEFQSLSFDCLNRAKPLTTSGGFATSSNSITSAFYSSPRERL